MTGKKNILGILIAFLVAVSFVPISGETAFATGLQNAFHASGHVTGLSVASTQYNSVTIQWTAYSGAEGYEICRADKKKGKYKKIATVKGCSFKDKGNKKLGKKKYYKVRAFGKANSGRKYTSYSSVLAAKPRVGTPAGLTSLSNTDSVTLKWKKVPGATGYQIYRATSKTGKYTRLATTKKKKYTNASLSAGKRYFYKVRAFKKKNGKKYGKYTTPVEGTTRPGCSGGFNTVLSEGGVVTSTWGKAAGASGYQLQRAATADGAYVTIAETTALSQKDTLTESGQYYYRVRAFATLNGTRIYGDFSSGDRSSAVGQARSWLGCKESNGSHKKIIDVYNKYGSKYGQIGYRTPWCAAFVSAVAIKTGNTGVIPVDCYCPRMLSNFSKKTSNKSYTPRDGDIVFYDWNRNKVPDHVGMVETVSGSSVTAIEGNNSDSVKRRTFKKGYSLLLSYGLPQYAINNVVSYTAPETADEETEPVIAAASVTGEDIRTVCEEITAEESMEASAAEPTEAPATEPTDVPATETEQIEVEAFAAEAEEAETEPAVEEEPATDFEVAEKIIDYIQEEEPAENASAEESEYNAFLVYGVCDEMDIDACVVTITDGSGESRSYNEVVLDGELYILNATEDGGVLEQYTPEEIN